MEHKIRMIGFDLDGTILDSKKHLPQENIDAVMEAIASGVIVLPATGRPKVGVPKEVLAIPGIRYLLASNGTRIEDLQTGEMLHHVCLSHEMTMDLARQLSAVADGMWELYCHGKCYVDEATYHFVEHPAMTEPMKKYLITTRTFVPNLLEYMEEHQLRAEKFQTFYENQQRKDLMMEILDREPEVVVTSSSVFNLEINSIKAGKGNGLLELGRLLGIAKEEIMAIGDSSNDWDMLKKVGFPVVMENGDEETKKLGKYITKRNDEYGVAYAIRKFVLGKE